MFLRVKVFYFTMIDFFVYLFSVKTMIVFFMCSIYMMREGGPEISLKVSITLPDPIHTWRIFLFSLSE